MMTVPRPFPTLAALAAVLAFSGCDAPAPEPDLGPGAPEATEGVETPGTPEAPDTSFARPHGYEATEAPVRVWFSRGDSLVAAPRPGMEREVRLALESLVGGPTAEERSRGLSSWFGEETRNVVGDVRLESDRLVVDFQGVLPSLIPGAGSSAGSEVLLGALDSTVFQFGQVHAVEYRLEGSCAAFWEWLQRECVVVRR